MAGTEYEQIISFDDLGFPIQTAFGKKLTPEDRSLTQPLRHKELEIKLFLSGSAIADIGSASYLCRAGDVLLVNPNETHSIRSLSGTAEYHLLMVDPAFLLGRGDTQDFRYLKPFFEGRTVFENLIRGDNQLYDTVNSLFRELEDREEAYELAVRGTIYRLFSYLLRRHVKSVMTRSEVIARQKYGAMLAPALSHISENLASQLPLDTLASLCGITPKYFCKVFRALTGMTSSAYIMEQRIARAEVLILGTSLPIAEIAESTGFSDPCYFSRCFRKLRGAAPITLR